MVIWTVKNVHNELVGIAKEISRKNVGGVSWLLAATYDDVGEV